MNDTNLRLINLFYALFPELFLRILLMTNISISKDNKMNLDQKYSKNRYLVESK